jgi:cytochrome c biogenesis protein
LRQVWHSLARLDLATILLSVTLALAAVGTCFPQLAPQVAANPERLARWEEALRAQYGRLAGALTAVGVFNWFRSPLFLGPLALLVLVTLTCTLERWSRVWRRAFDRPVVCPDAVFDSTSCTAVLFPPLGEKAGGEVSLVRERLEQRGFRVRVAEAGTTNQVYLRGDRNHLTPLATLATHLAVLLLALGALLSCRLSWRETLTLVPGATVEIGHGSGLVLRNDGFTVERYPDGSAAGYEAAVAVLAGGQETAHGTMWVNAPLAYQGVRLYLQAYEESAEGTSVTLLAVHDPGYGPVIAAGLLLLLGLTASFYFPHTWVHARIEPDGALRLAGRADRRAWDFEREFAALADEIGSR